MSRWKVLVTAPRALSTIDRYRQELDAAGCDVLVGTSVERLDEQALLPLVHDVDGIICGDDQITSRVLDSAPRLRVISKWGTGIDSIDVGEARRRGIAVCNTPGAFSEPVADTVLGYLLLFTRRLDRMADDMRAGRWERLPLRALQDCSLGIVGVGSSGRAVARRAAACGMRTFGYDVQPPPDALVRDLGIDMVPLEALLAASDFVTLHVVLDAGSRRLIDARRLSLMKPTAALINTSRGELVDEEALITALRHRRLAGAALDVFGREPLPADSPLRTLQNVYLAPHNANASAAAAEQVHRRSIDNLLQALGAATLS